MKHHISTKTYFIVCLSEERITTFWAVTWGRGLRENSSNGDKGGKGGYKNIILTVALFLNGLPIKLDKNIWWDKQTSSVSNKFNKDHAFKNPAGNYIFNVNRARCEICSKITIKTLERRHWCHWRCAGVFFVNLEYISHLVLAFLLLILSR